MRALDHGMSNDVMEDSNPLKDAMKEYGWLGKANLICLMVNGLALLGVLGLLVVTWFSSDPRYATVALTINVYAFPFILVGFVVGVGARWGKHSMRAWGEVAAITLLATMALSALTFLYLR